MGELEEVRQTQPSALAFDLDTYRLLLKRLGGNTAHDPAVFHL